MILRPPRSTLMTHSFPTRRSSYLSIAEAESLDAARIVFGAGADELIGLLVRAYAGPGDEVLYSEHGFLMYAISAKTAGATAVAAPEANLTDRKSTRLNSSH